MYFQTLVTITALSMCLSAASKKSGGEKLIENYNIPLWPEGKVPLAVGDGPLDKPFITVFQATEGKHDGCSEIRHSTQ